MLEVHDLAGRRGATRLFAGLGFRVDAGRALTVSGPNGSGKTTLLRMLAGLTAPEAGVIRWQGAPVTPFAAALRNAVLWMGHSPALKDELSAEENLASLTALAGVPATPDAIRAALEAVALGAQRALPAKLLSAGQRRRVGLARLALVRRPLWLLDEPATALDSEGASQLAALIERHLDLGNVAVVATHQMLGVESSRVQSLALG